jgi:chromosome segregation ATPase
MERQAAELRQAAEGLSQQLRTVQAEKDRLQQQATQLASGRQALERDAMLLKGEGERLHRELSSARARQDRLEQSARAAAAQLEQALGQD